MDKVLFRKGVHQGSILRFGVQKVREGSTSVQYQVDVYCDDIESGQEERVFSTHITFVRVDAEGRKAPLKQPS